MSCLRVFSNLKCTRLRPALRRPLSVGKGLRFASSYTATIARYYEHGAVDKVLKIDEEVLPPVGPNQIVVKMLAAPLNPADFNMIEGVYSIRPPLPAVGGNEGVGVVIEKGDAVTSVNVNDWVIPAQPGFGTWRTYAVGNAADFMTVDNNIPKETAATIAVNPCTAYRMLNDFRKLNPGDVIIQNGANSAVGMCVIQIAKTMGVKTINVIRDRPDLASVVHGMKELGADIVVTEEQLANTPVMTKMLADEMGADPVLGLNCVGGKSVAEVSRFLADKASLVTYGGMSRKPVTVPTGKLIFNDIHLRGFWLSRWTLEHSREERKQMIDAVTKLVRAGKLKSSFDPVSFPNIQEALSRVNAPQRNSKVIFTFA